MMNLSVHIGNLKLKNPVTVASGTFDYLEDFFGVQDIKKLGALIPKTVTLRARVGNPPLRIVETPSGMINAIGLENAGADSFIKNKLSVYRKIGTPIIVSISADSDNAFAQLAKRLNKAKGVAALELNLSCPNLKRKVLVAQSQKATYQVVKAVRKVVKIPVIAKLSPNVTDISLIAQAAEDAGADAVSLVNTFAAMAIDIKTRTPLLGNVTGGLSGPAIKPMGVYMVYKTAQKIHIPIVAIGGIMTADDAMEYLIAGATMVAVGTAFFIDPQAPWNILKGIKKYMKENKIGNITKLIGSLKVAHGQK